MGMAAFDSGGWRKICQRTAVQCDNSAMTPMHYTFLYGQQIDDALGAIESQFAFEAIEVAREFGYDTPTERHELRTWVTQRAREAATAVGCR
jgi:hypothetical protein